MEFKPLDQYFINIMARPFGMLKPVTITQYGPMLGIVLDRQDYFQTELFIIPGDIKLIEYHHHPNVDVYQLAVCGDFIFESNGVKYSSSPEVIELNQKILAGVPPGHIHGLLVNAASCFMTFQYWKNGATMDSVGNDFVLDVNNPNHFKGLKGLNRDDEKVFNRTK